MHRDYIRQIERVAERLSVTAADLLEWAENLNPPNQDYVPWIMRQLRAGQITYPNDGPKLQPLLKRFARLTELKQLGYINQYTPAELKAQVEKRAWIESHGKGSIGVDPASLPGVTLWAESPNYRVYQVTNPHSFGKLSSHAKWCTNPREKKASEKQTYYIKQTPKIIYRDYQLFCGDSPEGFINQKHVFITIDSELRSLLAPSPETLDTDTLLRYAKHSLEPWPEAINYLQTHRPDFLATYRPLFDKVGVPTTEMARVLYYVAWEGRTMRREVLDIALKHIREKEPTCSKDLLADLERKLTP